jgi:hypothetical protein
VVEQDVQRCAPAEVAAIHSGNRNPSQSPSVSGLRAAEVALWKELLGTGVSGPNVYGIDVIWPGILNEYFIDLQPYFANEISLLFPEIAASYTVD